MTVSPSAAFKSVDCGTKRYVIRRDGVIRYGGSYVIRSNAVTAESGNCIKLWVVGERPGRGYWVNGRVVGGGCSVWVLSDKPGSGSRVKAKRDAACRVPVPDTHRSQPGFSPTTRTDNPPPRTRPFTHNPQPGPSLTTQDRKSFRPTPYAVAEFDCVTQLRQRNVTLHPALDVLFRTGQRRDGSVTLALRAAAR